MNKQSQLDELQEQILKDKVCPELAEQATQLVFGSGNPEADVMFVGEAPGKKEDIKGEPFIGAAGKFLNEMLASIGLKRADIYITNIVKYRPPNNRDPLPEEKSTFLPYLEKQIDIINPKVIVTLGRHSMDAILPGLIISQVHGQPFRVRKTENGKLNKELGNSDFNLRNSGFRVFMPLFHPAAALYNGSLRQTLFEDFAKLPAILKKIK